MSRYHITYCRCGPDPYPTFLFEVDPALDLTFYFDANPDPIRPFTLMLNRIRLLIDVTRNSTTGIRPTRLHCEPPRLQCEPPQPQDGPPLLHCESPQLPAFHSDVDPRTGSGFSLWCGSGFGFQKSRGSMGDSQYISLITASELASQSHRTAPLFCVII